MYRLVTGGVSPTNGMWNTIVWSNFCTHIRTIAIARNTYTVSQMRYIVSNELESMGANLVSDGNCIEFETEEDASIFRLRFG